MKKITLIAIAIFSIAFASFGSNSLTAFNNTDNSVIEKAKPHTKEYQDMKKVIDAYEEAVNMATSCDDLENASIAFFLGVLSLVEEEYAENEEITEQEDRELSDKVDRINSKMESLRKKWNCPVEGEDEELEQELIPTTTQEWDDILNQFDAIVTQLENMKGLDFDKDENLNKLMEIVLPLEMLSDRIDHSSLDNITAKQTSRLEALNDRLMKAATDLGLTDELDE